MNREFDKLGFLEEGLLELDAASRAGLFRTTPVQPPQLTAAKKRLSHRQSFLRFWGPVSAAAVITIGVWTIMFQNWRGERPKQSQTSAIGPINGEGVFSACLTGPGQVAVASCTRHDYDSDGDVDLADYMAYQQSKGAVTQ